MAKNLLIGLKKLTICCFFVKIKSNQNGGAELVVYDIGLQREGEG